MTPATDSRFSVVIPTKNRTDSVEAAILALARQTAPPAEIIVIDQSADPARSIEAMVSRQAGAGCRLTYVHAPEVGGAAEARNVGLRLANCPLVLFLDDDAVPEPDCLAELGRALRDHPELKAVAAVISNYTPPPRAWLLFRRIFWRGVLWDERQPVYWSAAGTSGGGLVRTRKLNGGCMAFRAATLKALGGFDPRYRGASIGEDIEVSERTARVFSPRRPLALVRSARIYHESKGDWKNDGRRLEFELVATHYWYFRNLPPTVGNGIRFAWMALGMGASALISALSRRRSGPLRSVLAGWTCIRSRYAGCPFLEPPAAD